MSGPDQVALVAAGVVAGAVGSAGGITSLISFPALLVVGVPAVVANVSNTLALVACWPGSALASRPELRGTGRWLTGYGMVAAAGGLLGALLLLSTPPGVFVTVVPYLLAAASAVLLGQPWLSAWWSGRRQRRGAASALPGGLLAVSVYNGYFGAGAGVMVLALLMITVDTRLAEANARKNMLIGVATAAGALVYVISGRVDYAAALPLAAGLFAGSALGPLVARRAPATVLRSLVAATGFGLALRLWIAPL